MLLVAALRRSQSGPVRGCPLLLQIVKPLPKQSLALICTRLKTTATKSIPINSSAPPRRFLYPEKFCVYHAGTGKVTFIACMKLSTLFLFAFFGLVVTPSYLDKEGWGWTTTRTALSAVVPLVFLAYVTSPFVSFIHIRLPPLARQSEEGLKRFARTLPQKTELYITTLSHIAKPRVATVQVSELRPTRNLLAIHNYGRDTTAENAARKWYNFRAVGRFNIQANKSNKAPWVWEEIERMIARKKRI